jgi:hypothetical protein
MSFLTAPFTGTAGGQAYNTVNPQQVGVQADPNAAANLAQQGNINAQQQNFVNMLQQRAQGQGPSVAGQQLQQTLQQQQAGAAAQAAGARGINPALAMRSAMEQQGQAGQAAAQSGAIARAGEAMNAQGQLGGQLGQMAGQNLQQQNLGLQQQALDVNAQKANQGAGLEAGALNSQIGQAQNTNQGSILGSIGKTIGQAGMLLADGGSIPGYDSGGITPIADQPYQPTSILGNILNGMTAKNQGDAKAAADQGSGGFNPGQMLGKGISSLMGSSGPQAPAGVPSSQQWANFTGAPDALGAAPSAGDASFGVGFGAAHGGKVPSNMGSKLKAGGHVPGKAKASGNNYKNDTVKAMLSPGEGVIDRETMADQGKVGDAARFVMAYVNKKKASK